MDWHTWSIRQKGTERCVICTHISGIIYIVCAGACNNNTLIIIIQGPPGPMGRQGTKGSIVRNQL